MALEELLKKLGVEVRPQAADSGSAQKIRVYTAYVGEGEISAGDGLKALVDYFGNPTKQGAEARPVFEELILIQHEMSPADHWFGRYGLIIIEGQLAFRKIEGDLVELAVYKPFEDTPNQEASIAIYQFNKKDFPQ